MLNEKKQPNNRPFRKQPVYTPLTADELDLLYKKKYIDEAELLRLLGISTSTVYKLIRSKELVPAWLGSKKMFDIEELYVMLDQSKRRGRER